MTDTWDGRPENPKRDGWHWLCRAKDSWTVCKWWSAEQGGWVDGITLSPASVVEFGVSYLGPCLAPAEVEAHVAAARREGIEAALREAQSLFAPGPMGWSVVADAIRALLTEGGR